MKRALKNNKVTPIHAEGDLNEGLTLQAVGNMYDYSRQAVNDTINVVLKTLKAFKQAKANEIEVLTRLLPAGWSYTTIAAPTPMIKR
jgi:hypothetical protein